MDYGASRSKALSSQGPRAFFFSRAATRAMTEPFAPSSAKASRVGNSVLRDGDRCSLFFLMEDTMSVASQVIAYRPLGVLLGGSFAPQRSIEPKPLVCALLR